MTPQSLISHLQIIEMLEFRQTSLESVRVLSVGAFHIGIKTNAASFNTSNYCDNWHSTAIFLGHINNEMQLRELLPPDAYESSVTGVELMHHIYKQRGAQGIAIASGCFAFITVDHQSDQAHIYTDPLGLMPIYYTHQLGCAWATNQAKCLIGNKDFDTSLRPRNSFNLALRQPSNFSLFQCIHKLPKGHGLTMCENTNDVKPIKDPYYSLKPNTSTASLTKADASVFLDHLLHESVNMARGSTKHVGALLSGGLDSSLVTSLAAGAHENVLHTVSMGTALSNEFKWAKIVADHIGSVHHELLLSNEDIMHGIATSVYENEIFDGLSAEIHAPMPCLYDFMKSFVVKLLTGYGADLLFGGTLPLDTSKNDVNQTLWNQILRTQWTGEFSPFLPSRYGITVEHPFWHRQLIEFATSLPAHMKLYNNEHKVILRSVGARYLPREIYMRPKIGIHQASSINKIFATFLGDDGASDNGYEKKDDFIYYLFQKLFNERLPLNSINLQQCVEEANSIRTSFPLLPAENKLNPSKPCVFLQKKS